MLQSSMRTFGYCWQQKGRQRTLSFQGRTCAKKCHLVHNLRQELSRKSFLNYQISLDWCEGLVAAIISPKIVITSKA